MTTLRCWRCGQEMPTPVKFDLIRVGGRNVAVHREECQ